MQPTALLAIFLAMLAIPAMGEGLALTLPPLTTLGLGVGILLIFASLVRWTTRLALQQSLRSGGGSITRGPARLETLQRGLAVVTYAVILLPGGYAQLVLGPLRLDELGLLSLALLVLLAPYIILEVVRLAGYYPLNRHIREQVVFHQLSFGLAARPVWSRREYISFYLRSGLATIAAPVLLILAWRDAAGWAGPVVMSRFWPEISEPIQAAIGEGLALAGVVAVFVLAPAVLKRVWRTRPLPAGVLRRKLERFCRLLGLRYRRLLLWDTYSSVGNAAVTGVVGAVRYVLLSDALLENTPDEQIEAVFGHEAGHVRYHHIPYMVAFVMGYGLAAGVVLELVQMLANHGAEAWGLSARLGYIPVGMVGGLLAMNWFLWFGAISRRFERQADVHGALAVGQMWALDQAAAEAEIPVAEDKIIVMTLPERGETLSSHGAAVMSGALQRIALLNGVSAYARSWRHSSIASRAAFLRELASEPGALRRFMKQVRRVKLTILALVLTGALATAALYFYLGFTSPATA